MSQRLLAVVGTLVVCAAPVFAASFIVPSDRDFVQRAPAIVIGSALESHMRLNDRGGIETVTTFSIEETIKGTFETDTIDLVESGGFYEGRAEGFPGTPRFKDGERDLLFLMKDGEGKWHVLDLTLGKFHFATDILGREVVLRDMHDVLALEPGGGDHREATRAAGPFLDFVRATAHGGPARQDYVLPLEPLVGMPSPAPQRNGRLTPVPTATYTAESYTMDLSGGEGGRWTTWPVNFGSVGSEPGAQGNPPGSTAISAAFNAWNTAAGASVNYVYTGNDSSNTTNSPCGNPDGKNTIAFEYDLSCEGISAFTCTSNSYGGTLGLGGVSNAGNPITTTPDGSQFVTTTEGDVWMNKGIANCTLLLSTNVGDWNSALTHETGHTLGFRHADQNRHDNGACGTDAIAEECSSSAIMTATVTMGLNATLQTWDQHAVTLVYPAGSAPAAVSSVVATATSSTNVQVTWSGSCSSTCHVYRSADHLNYTLVGSSAASPFNDSSASPNAAYLYKVRAFNGSTESADSNRDLATTVIYTDDPLVAGSTVIKAVHLSQLRTAVNAVRTLAGLAAPSYSNSGVVGTVVYAVDVTELRTYLDQARSQIGFPTGGYTNTITSGVIIHAVDFQEIRDRMK